MDRARWRRAATRPSVPLDLLRVGDGTCSPRCSEEVENLCEVVPELIAGRFVAIVRPHCKSPDKHEIRRRLPACKDVAELEGWERRASSLADVILSRESKGGAAWKAVGDISHAKPGTLVFHPAVGVSVLFDRELSADGAFSIVDLSKSERPVRKFIEGVVEVDLEGWPLPWDPTIPHSLGMD